MMRMNGSHHMQTQFDSNLRFYASFPFYANTFWFSGMVFVIIIFLDVLLRVECRIYFSAVAWAENRLTSRYKRCKILQHGL